MVLHEDLSCLRPGAGTQNTTTVRRMALNLLRGPEDERSLKVRRTSAAWDADASGASSGIETPFQKVGLADVTG